MFITFAVVEGRIIIICYSIQFNSIQMIFIELKKFTVLWLKLCSKITRTRPKNRCCPPPPPTICWYSRGPDIAEKHRTSGARAQGPRTTIPPHSKPQGTEGREPRPTTPNARNETPATADHSHGKPPSLLCSVSSHC